MFSYGHDKYYIIERLIMNIFFRERSDRKRVELKYCTKSTSMFSDYPNTITYLITFFIDNKTMKYINLSIKTITQILELNVPFKQISFSLYFIHIIIKKQRSL